MQSIQRKFSTLTTFNHDLIEFTNQPILNLSAQTYAHLRVYFTPTTIKGTKFFYVEKRNIPFPDGTRGFFYYRQDPRFPLIDGAVRFRVVPPDADTFDAPGAEDLRTPDGKTWQRKLFFIYLRRDKTVLDKLEAEKLVHRDARSLHLTFVKRFNRQKSVKRLLADETLSDKEREWAELRAQMVRERRDSEPLPRRPRAPSTRGRGRPPRPHRKVKVRPDPATTVIPAGLKRRRTDERVALEYCRLYTPNDTFTIDLSRVCLYLHVGKPNTPIDTRLDIYYIFRDKRDMYTQESSHGVAPYSVVQFVQYGADSYPSPGKITARFELKTMPDSKNQPRTYFFIRVVDILEPIIPLVEGYDGFIDKPVIGRLLGRQSQRSGKGKRGADASVSASGSPNTSVSVSGRKKKKADVTEGEYREDKATAFWRMPVESPRGQKLLALFEEAGANS
uniref:Uncharacterized protein n=1 Tax=Psilocybe cubensis TaxID=181762 RepID=A0A8H7XJ12_PSICU